MEKVQDNLYYIDRILRVEEQKGELVAVVKWENFSYRHVTREKIDHLKHNPNIRPDLQRKEAEYKIKPFVKSIDHQLHQDIQNIQRKLYQQSMPQDSSKMVEKEKNHRNEGKRKNHMQPEDKELTAYQKALCIFQASQVMLKQVKAGLGNLEPKDYFRLSDLKQEAQKRTKRIRSRKELITQAAVQQIKGFLKVEDDFKFCISIKSKVFTVPSQKVLQLCPNLLLIYLTKLLAFISRELKSEIEKEQAVLRGKKFKAKSIEMVSKMLNITQHMLDKARTVHFGLNGQDLHHNIQLHKKSFLQQQYSDDDKESYNRENVALSKSRQKDRKKDEYETGLTMAEDLKCLYLNIKNQIVATLKGDIDLPQTKKKSKRAIQPKSPQYITISSRSASRSRSKPTSNDKYSDVSISSSKKVKAISLSSDKSSENRGRGRRRGRSRSRVQGENREHESSYSVWQNSESQAALPSEALKRLPSQQFSSIKKRFKRI